MYNIEVEEKIIFYISRSKIRYITIRGQTIYYDEYKDHLFKKAGFNNLIEDIEDTISNNPKFYVYKIKDGFVVKENDGSNKLVYHPYTYKNDIILDFKKDLKKEAFQLNYLDMQLNLTFKETPFNIINLHIDARNKKQHGCKEIALTRNKIKEIVEKIKNKKEDFGDELEFHLGNKDDSLLIVNIIYIDTNYFDKEYYSIVYVELNDIFFEMYFIKEEYDIINKILIKFI